jgi:hypothetical protein
MNDKDLQKHILSTYNSLRFGLGATAFATPIIVPLWAWLWGASWQDSLSAYYFAPIADKMEYSVYPGRVLFVGILFALGSFLFLYKGFSRREDNALNLAGLCALGVAICPMYAQMGYIPLSNRLHGFFAVLLFACMAYTAIWCKDETLRWLPNPDRRAYYRRLYNIIALVMVLFPLIALALAVFSNSLQRYVFWAEWVGIWAFAAYWWTKSRELAESEAEIRAVTGRLTPPRP